MQSPQVHLRPLTVADIPTVTALWRSCEGVGMSESDDPVHLSAFLARNPGMSSVAIADGGVVGAVLSGHDGRRGFLYHLAVHPAARRRGIGRQLVDETLRGLRAAGILKCQIVVFQVNEDAKRFWLRLGWTPRDDLHAFSKVL
ncbi:MAG: GNAT family N-acetyltransferase [Deltaproteobacteria bacterium]|nr:GNAT family N-acetyltransferase [Deltaproteobacteria bacterium]